jgi:ribonuclease BN (tRNA processing enzyme)
VILFFCTLDGRQFSRPRQYLPPGGHDLLLTLSGIQDPSRTFFEDCFEVVEYDHRRVLEEEPFAISFIPVLHVPHTYAVRVRGDATFAFSADSGPCDALARVAGDCDLFLCECGNREASTYPFLLTPRQAAAVAKVSGARGLLLTHRWWRHGEETAISEARENYDGPIDLAREGLQVTIERLVGQSRVERADGG